MLSLSGIQGWEVLQKAERGVVRRSDKLADEYRKPLAILHRIYHGTEKGGVGPLSQEAGELRPAPGTCSWGIPGGQPRHPLSSGNSC